MLWWRHQHMDRTRSPQVLQEKIVRLSLGHKYTKTRTVDERAVFFPYFYAQKKLRPTAQSWYYCSVVIRGATFACICSPQPSAHGSIFKASPWAQVAAMLCPITVSDRKEEGGGGLWPEAPQWGAPPVTSWSVSCHL